MAPLTRRSRSPSRASASISSDGAPSAASTSAALPILSAATSVRARTEAVRQSPANAPNSPTSAGALATAIRMGPPELSAQTSASPETITSAKSLGSP